MSNTDQIEEITKLMCKFKQEPYEPLPCGKCCYNYACHYQSTAKALCDADFVKVVRCKDCRFWKGSGVEKERFDLTGLARCIRPLGEWTKDIDCGENDFCSYGERKD